VNCAAIPDTLLESELFGYAPKSAISGSDPAGRAGRFEQADHGTLFLDEIGEMKHELQAKLLRVLQDREIRPVGGTQSVKVDVRIIAATNKDLEAELVAGRFREDLYYRLNVIPIHISPLRERPEDVPPLVDAFLRKHADERRCTVSPAAMQRLCRHAWRGNGRELENVIERALALTENPEIGPEDLPFGRETSAGDPADELLRSAARQGVCLRDLEDRYIDQILEFTGGNKVRAARILGIDRKTLYRRAERRAVRSGAGSS
jgi:transcriptional regulator with PAS, ATPase and Fis domain